MRRMQAKKEFGPQDAIGGIILFVGIATTLVILLTSGMCVSPKEATPPTQQSMTFTYNP